MNNLISEPCSIKDVMKVLDETALKVVFVVDNQNKLLGTISDGDIRRALLQGYSLSDPIESIKNTKFHYITQNTTYNEIKKLFLEKKIDLIPVIDHNCNYVSSLSWEDFFSKKKIIKRQKIQNVPVVVMAGGKGTRMAPFTDILPKPLIPINGKSILELIIEEFRQFAINDYYFTLNYKGKIIESYFDSLDKNYNLTYIWEEKFLGTGGSLHLLDRNKIESDFIVTNCDNIVKVDYYDVLKFHREQKSMITMLSSYQHFTFPYGVVEFEKGGVITTIKEKPEFSFPVNTGVYILSKECLELIPENKFFNLPDLIYKVQSIGKKALVYPVNEKDFIDIGQWKEYQSVISDLRFL